MHRSFNATAFTFWWIANETHCISGSSVISRLGGQFQIFGHSSMPGGLFEPNKVLERGCAEALKRGCYVLLASVLRGRKTEAAAANKCIRPLGVVSGLEQTWHTSSQRDNSYGSDRIFDSADAAKMCGYVTYHGSQCTDEKYGDYKCWPTFVLIFLCPNSNKQHVWVERRKYGK